MKKIRSTIARPMMDKVFRFAESHQGVDRLVAWLGRGAVTLGIIAAVVLFMAFVLRSSWHC